MFRITILAARRVLPPLLITPAKASYPFMKETGPLATPPPERRSLLDRMRERLLPAPEPPLNRRASVAARRMMLSMSSSTLLMKQALHCGFGFSGRPTLDQ